jgi:hypothetical protein
MRSEETRPEGRSEKTRAENGAELRAEETSSDKNQKMKRERRRTSQVASSGRHYFRVIVIVIVNELSKKQVHLIRNPFVSCHGTPDMCQYEYCMLLGGAFCVAHHALLNMEFVTAS